MERTFDVENGRTLLRFHREKGQIFCRTVEFLNATIVETAAEDEVAAGEEEEGKRITEDDVKVVWRQLCLNVIELCPYRCSWWIPGKRSPASVSWRWSSPTSWRRERKRWTPSGGWKR